MAFSKVSESLTCFFISLCGIFYFPWHRHHIEGTNSFQCLFQKAQAKWDERNCPNFETAESNHRPLDRQAGALTIRQMFLSLTISLKKIMRYSFNQDLGQITSCPFYVIETQPYMLRILNHSTYCGRTVSTYVTIAKDVVFSISINNSHQSSIEETRCRVNNTYKLIVLSVVLRLI